MLGEIMQNGTREVLSQRYHGEWRQKIEMDGEKFVWWYGLNDRKLKKNYLFNILLLHFK